ncbi:MAG: thioesterase [Hespellia sp.]|nr:thioesterase [Hespellia sp.]
MKYTFDGRVRYSEIDHTGTMTIPSLINYFQDCSTFQSEDLGVGLELLKEKHRAWLLNSWQIEFVRMPKMGERITVGTFAHEFKGLFGMRNFFLKDSAGEYLAYANSAWFYLDTENGRPCKPDQQEIALYGSEPKLKMEYKGRKIKLPKETETAEPFAVRKYHIDTNDHVNNSQYVQMALEILGDVPKIREVRVEYKQAAVYGDIICPKIAREEDRMVVELCSQEGAAYAVVELMA